MVDIPQRLGRIVTRDGYSYQITPADVLWLARSVHKEGGSNAATIWAYFQLQASARRSASLASLVLAHSQPVNPEWRRDGIHCRPGGDYAGQDNCAPSLLEQRDANAVRPWTQIPIAVREVVARAVTGNLPNPVPRAINFADERVSRGFLSRPANAGSGVVLKAPASACPACNWYLYEARSANWPANFVQVELDGRRSSEAALAAGLGLGTLFFAGAVGLGVYLWRKR